MKNKSEARYFSFYTFATLTNIIGGYTILYLLTNFLTKADYAQFGYVNSVFSLLLVLFNFGSKEAVFKLTSKDDGKGLDSLFSWFAAWQLILVIGALCLSFWDFANSVIFFCFLATSWLLTCIAWHRGKKHYFRDAYAIPLQRILWLICLIVWLLIADEIDYLAVFSASLAASLMTLLTVNVGVRVTISKTLNFKPPSILMKFFLIESAILAYTRIDVIVLKSMNIVDVELADYYFSVQVFDAAILVLAPISYFFFSRLASAKSVHNSLRLILSYCLVLTLIVILGQVTWWFVGELFLTYFAPQYLTAKENISLFIWALYPLALNLILSSYLILLNKEVKYAFVCFVGLLFYLCACYLLVPLHGAIGAIQGRIGVELLLFIFMLTMAIRNRRQTCH